MSPSCPDCARGLIPDPEGIANSLDTRHRHRLPPELAIQLVAAKEKLGTTYRLLGNVIGRDHGYLVHLFHGDRAPSMATAQRLISVLPLHDDTATALLDVAVEPREYPARRV